MKDMYKIILHSNNAMRYIYIIILLSIITNSVFAFDFTAEPLNPHFNETVRLRAYNIIDANAIGENCHFSLKKTDANTYWNIGKSEIMGNGEAIITYTLSEFPVEIGEQYHNRAVCGDSAEYSEIMTVQDTKGITADASFIISQLFQAENVSSAMIVITIFGVLFGIPLLIAIAVNRRKKKRF